jgi:hypothetical protein
VTVAVVLEELVREEALQELIREEGSCAEGVRRADKMSKVAGWRRRCMLVVLYTYQSIYVPVYVYPVFVLLISIYKRRPR